MTKWTGVALMIVLALAVAACGSRAGKPVPTDLGSALSVEQALEQGGPLRVEGFLVAPEGREVRLCAVLLESYPPQCGGASLVVEGLDLATVQGLTKTNDPSLAQVRWSDKGIQLDGTVEDGVLTVSA